MIQTIAATRDRIAHSPLASRFVGGAVWSLAGTVISSSISLMAMMFVAQILGKEGYGQLVIIQSTLGMVGVFAGAGIGVAATRYAAEFRVREPVRLGHILGLAERSLLAFGLIATLGLLSICEWLSTHIINAPDLRGQLSIAALAVCFMAFDNYHKSVLIGLESMRTYATGAIAGALLTFPIILIAAKAYGLSGTVTAFLLSAILQCGISRYQIRKELNEFGVIRNASGCFKEFPVLWNFALPALLAGALVAPSHWATQAMLANTTNGYKQLAFLGIAMQWFSMTLFLPTTAARVVLPILTDHVTKNDETNSRKLLLYSITANVFLTIPAAILVSILSPLIMGLYGEDFRGQYFPLVLAAMAATLVAVQTPVGNMVAARSKMWLGAVMNTGWALAYIASAYVLIDQGAIGVMYALIIGHLAHTVWVSRYAIKTFR